MKALGALLLVVIPLYLGSAAACGEGVQIPLPEGAVARLGMGWITQVAYSPDGEYLALATSLGIELRDEETLELVRFFRGHTAPVRSVAFSPDGKTLASASGDRMVRGCGTWRRARRYVPLRSMLPRT